MDTDLCIYCHMLLDIYMQIVYTKPECSVVQETFCPLSSIFQRLKKDLGVGDARK